MKISVRNIIILFITLIFLSGFVVVSNNGIHEENPSASLKASCPNILLRNGNKLSLLNTSTPNIKPLYFDNLEEYRKYHDGEKEKNGSGCPILYIQEENDTQGKDVLKIYPNPFDIEIGLLTMPLTNSIEGMHVSMKENVGDVMTLEKSGYDTFDSQGINVGVYI